MSGRPVKRKTPRGTGRAAWGTISREQVVEAATRVVRNGGFEQMTIRGLAAELGVAPMSLYRHVRDKDDLLDEVVGVLLAEVWRPEIKEAPARLWLSDAAERLRSFLVAQPAALHVYLRHPVVSPAAIERMETMVQVLQEAIGDTQAAWRGYASIHTYTVGFAALEAAREGWKPAEAAEEGVAAFLSTYTTPRQFSAGLGYLLDGIGLRSPSRGRPRQ